MTLSERTIKKALVHSYNRRNTFFLKKKKYPVDSTSGVRCIGPVPPVQESLIKITPIQVKKSDGVKAGYVAKALAEHLPNITSFEERKALILESLPK